jgi:hypothetical protein
MRQLRMGVLVFVPAVFVVSLAGCGPSQLPKNATYPVNGKVTLHGEPAAWVMIHLEPTEPNKGVYAEGLTRQDGTFQLRTYSQEEADGAAVGEYKVVLEPYDPVRAVGKGAPPPGAKASPLKGELDTGQTVEVKAEDNTLEITVP